MDVLHVSERRACRALGQHRSTQRKVPRGRDDEAALTADLVELARRYGRYGDPKIGALLKAAGWFVNDKRVERIWRREGLKVPGRQPKKGRLWDGDGSCIRLKPERRDHVWSYDFVEARTHDGRKFRMLNVVDEFTRECLAIRVARKLKGADVIDVLSDLFMLRGVPEHVRSDNVLRSEEGRLARQQVSVREHAPAVCLSSTSIQAAPADPEELSAIANTGSSRCTRHRGPHRPQHEMSIQAGDPSIIYRVVVLTPSRLC
ncbi:HTH-like domain-containing protein [Methylobacterium sp. UNC378MF]|nr:HTH-like domain-containing protein [Methylobacterium sp. UNC378MF]